ncbi:hypothetical protein HanHA300_Chr12g0454621 [Helianthus annuus]|nr:hypothetical protein HanHA300_Chr12g0454621 [Helianthus annuus]KAJ0506284.1 hypothetical protein HanHA89_Chr12g0480201 [Helianthus annuus]KAJ0675956.1 hypothetical protein HanLR1_Chr12g0457121 [Helianthus annuus]KAJ0679203.1 hypothetical protein HanOQP8_Chr12g0456691 [Helianthus annuus]
MFPNAKLKTDRPNFLARRGNRALSRGNCALVFQVMVHAHIRARFLDSSEYSLNYGKIPTRFLLLSNENYFSTLIN